MSRISSTFGKQANEKFVRSSSKMYGGNYLTDPQKSLTLSGEQLRSSQTMKSTKGSLKTSKSFADTVRASTGGLEQEYIKSLQQQVYLLELENNHLRSQAVKATDMHPTMAAEAERMLQELKAQQAKVDALQMENFRKEGAAEVLQQKVNGLSSQLQQYEQQHQQERQQLSKGNTELRHERDMYQRDASRMQLRLNELEDDFQAKVSQVKAAEVKIVHLRGELESSQDSLAKAETSLADERAARSQLEARVKVLELELANAGTKALERSLRELRDENQFLKDKLRHEQGRSEEETLLRARNSEEASALVKRSAALEQQLVQLQRELQAERDKAQQWAQQVDADSQENVRLKQREAALQFQVTRGVEEVAELRLRCSQLAQQLEQAEAIRSDDSLGHSVTRRRVQELEAGRDSLAEQLTALRSERAQLQQQVESLQQQLLAAGSERQQMQAAMDRAEARLADTQAEVVRLQQLQATRWSEVEKMADSLRSAAQSNSMLFDRY